MMVHSSRRRRFGASISILLALVLAHAPHLSAATRRHAPQKKVAARKAPARTTASSSKTKKTTTKPVRKLTPQEVEQAGLLASERVDREQSEKMDPSARNAQIEDRVHAWMKKHHGSASDDNQVAAEKPRATKSAGRNAASAKSEPETKPAAKAKSGARKATAADFDAAAAVQSRSPEPKPTGKPRSAVTPLDDDNAERASQTASVDDEDVDTKGAGKKSAAVTVLAKKSSASAKKTTKSQDDDDDNPKTAELDDDEVAPPARLPVSPALRRDDNGHLIVPAPMKGTREILVHQNVMADREGLDRIENNGHLDRLRKAKLLVAIPASSALLVNRSLPANRRYTRPWTARFLADLARAHYAHFHEPIQVNSAVRTIEFQRRLIRVNGNAAPPTGETASPHLTGQAVDLAKRGMSLTEIAWMRGYLLPLVQQGKIDVEEEFQQACFHISVYKAYMPQAVPKRTIKQKRRGGRLLAAELP